MFNSRWTKAFPFPVDTTGGRRLWKAVAWCWRTVANVLKDSLRFHHINHQPLLDTVDRVRTLEAGTIIIRHEYTGHCPTLKFRIGKRYGANTQEIMKELSDRGVWRRSLAGQYRQSDPLRAMLTDGRFPVIQHARGQTKDLEVDSSTRCRRYILGYTGYIPGMHFRYGTSFRQAADESVVDFRKRMSQEASRRALEVPLRARSRSAPRLVGIRSRDQVKASLDQYCQHNQFQEAHITPEFPPIAGYTGHIPRVKGSEASLSQRYHTAAKRGLTILRQETEALTASRHSLARCR